MHLDQIQVNCLYKLYLCGWRQVSLTPDKITTVELMKKKSPFQAASVEALPFVVV